MDQRRKSVDGVADTCRDVSLSNRHANDVYNTLARGEFHSLAFALDVRIDSFLSLSLSLFGSVRFGSDSPLGEMRRLRHEV